MGEYGAVITLVIGFAALLVSMVTGFSTIKKNIAETQESITEHRVNMEHRFTVLETDLGWLKEHLPKRKTDG